MKSISETDTFIIFDLEWNQVRNKTKRKHLNEIIEIGAVKVDYHLNVLDTFRIYIHPVLSRKISKIVTDITNITVEDLEYGLSFHKAMKHFRIWSGSQAVFCSWGSEDIFVLKENCRFYNKNYQFKWLNQYLDLQQFCADTTKEIDACQYGLKRAADFFKLDYEDDKLHRALEDAKLATKVFQKIMAENRVENYLQNGAELELAQFITNINDNRIDRNMFRMKCPSCGRFLKKVDSWKVKNKKYRAHFECKNCKVLVIGKVAVRLVNGELVYDKTSKLVEREVVAQRG